MKNTQYIIILQRPYLYDQFNDAPKTYKITLR